MSDLNQVSPYGGIVIRMKITDCFGTLISRDEISRIQYTVYQEVMGKRFPVSGHEQITVPVECVLESEQSSPHTGETFNFEHQISAANCFPFPEHDRKYAAVYSFYDPAGEPHPAEIECWTGSTGE